MLTELAPLFPGPRDCPETEFPAIADRLYIPQPEDDFLYRDMMNDRTELSIIENANPHLKPSAAAIAR